MKSAPYAVLIFGLFAVAFFVLGAVSLLGVIRVLIKRGIMTVTFNGSVRDRERDQRKEPHA